MKYNTKIKVKRNLPLERIEAKIARISAARDTNWNGFFERLYVLKAQRLALIVAE